MKEPDKSAPALSDIVRSGGPDKRLKRRIFAALAVIIVGVLLWLWLSGRSNARKEMPVFATEPLRRGDIALVVTATGNLEPTNEVTVGSELSGTTLEVYVDSNDRVVKGQPLAKLDTSKLALQTESGRAALKSAKSKVNQAEATLREAEATLSRYQELRTLSNGKMPSKADFDSAQASADRAHADLLSAQAAVAEAEAQVHINESDLAKAIIKSPIDGIVLTRSLEPGQTVAASFTAPELFVIAENLEHMKLKISIAEADIGRVAKGQKASFTVDAWPNRSYTASVIKVSYGSSVTNNVVTYETELEVTNSDLSLRPGMTATASVRVAESKNVLMVPTAAMRFEPNAITAAGPTAAKRPFVQNLMPGPPRFPSSGKKADNDKPSNVPGTAHLWILRDGHPEAITVKTGLSDGRHTEVSSDQLVEGCEVILRANVPTS